MILLVGNMHSTSCLSPKLVVGGDCPEARRVDAADKGQMELYSTGSRNTSKTGRCTAVGIFLCAGKRQEHVELWRWSARHPRGQLRDEGDSKKQTRTEASEPCVWHGHG